MNRVRTVTVALFVTCLCLTSARGAAADGGKSASLAASLEDFIRQLEKDDVKAAGRLARDADAAKVLAERWAQLRQCHKDYNYRTWLDRNPATGGPGARQIGDAAKFTVGGHSFGHHHVDWEKGADGWRIVDVRICR